MKLIDFQKATDGLRQEAKALYFGSFPPEERRAWEEIPFAEDYFSFSLVVDDEEQHLIGFISLWNFGSYSYVEHFAVNPAMRGRGTGSRILGLVEGNLVLEVEPEDANDMAPRRIGFYRRNGFRLLDADYIQPPYAEDLPSLPLKLMSRGELPDIDRVISTLHQRVYNAD